MKITEILKEFESSENIAVRKLEYWAENLSDKTFIYYGEKDKSYSFKEFNNLANSFANNLLANGIKIGDRISVFLEDNFVSALAMFGIWKVGAVYCPINFNYKGRLLLYQINDTRPKVVITETYMMDYLNEIKENLSPITVMLNHGEENTENYDDFYLNNTKSDDKFRFLSIADFITGDDENPEIDLDYSDTANIIYTSGTTGPAKGVVQSHRWVCGYSSNYRMFNTQEDILYTDLPMYHVGGAFGFVARAAFLGCTVAIWNKFSTSDFWRRIKATGATDAALLDVMIPWLMNQEATEDDQNNSLTRVYMQPLPEYHNKVAKRFGINFVFAGYGQTESSSSFFSVIDELEESGTPEHLYKGYRQDEMYEIAKKYDVPIIKGNNELAKGFMGGVLPYFEATILNEKDEECEVGEAGEIALRPRLPHFILKQYFNNDAATYKAFKNLWFHTGDTAYKDENNIYYFIDRMNNVIRTRGENISSYQIEDYINQHELVNVCAAFPVPSKESDEDDIVVYVVPKSNHLNKEVLMEWIKKELPKFMWPKFIKMTIELPRTPTNKVEKYKLKTKFLNELK